MVYITYNTPETVRQITFEEPTIETYFKDRRNGKKWDEEDLQKFRGNISYYLSVEPATIAGVIQKYNAKYGADLLTCISDDLKPKAA